MAKLTKKEELLDIIVEYKKDRYDVSVRKEDTLKDLKHLIYTITDVPTFRQVYSNFKSTAFKSEKSKLKYLELANGFVLKMRDVRYDPLPPIPQVHHGVMRRRNFTEMVGNPRPGKKLVVFDIDKLIYNRYTPNLNRRGRPHFQEFLAEIYADYDIAVWTTDNMDYLKYTLLFLGMDRHPDYKPLLYLDYHSIVTIFKPGAGRINVKPLDAIWRAYPQYNSKNTIICEDKVDNFHLNPSNGILVKRYFFAYYDNDEELYKLATYLKGIAHSEDVTVHDHTMWRLKVDAGDNDGPRGNVPEGDASEYKSHGGDVLADYRPVGEAAEDSALEIGGNPKRDVAEQGSVGVDSPEV